MEFIKYLNVKDQAVRIMKGDGTSYIMQYNLDSRIIGSKLYSSKEDLVKALINYVPESELMF